MMNHTMYSIPVVLIGLLCPIGILAFFVFVVIKIVQAIQAHNPGVPPVAESRSDNVTTQLAADGFWIISCPAAPMSTIYYYYWSAGARHAANIPYQPGADGRQFVYTGVRPEQVSISRIVEPDDDTPASSGTGPLDVLPGVIVADAVLNAMQPNEPASAPESPRFPTAY